MDKLWIENQSHHLNKKIAYAHAALWTFGYHVSYRYNQLPCLVSIHLHQPTTTMITFSFLLQSLKKFLDEEFQCPVCLLGALHQYTREEP